MTLGPRFSQYLESNINFQKKFSLADDEWKRRKNGVSWTSQGLAMSGGRFTEFNSDQEDNSVHWKICSFQYFIDFNDLILMSKAQRRYFQVIIVLGRLQELLTIIKLPEQASYNI